MTDKTLIAIALVPVFVFLCAMVVLLVETRFHVPAGLVPALAVIVTVGSIGLANYLRLRRGRHRVGKP